MSEPRPVVVDASAMIAIVAGEPLGPDVARLLGELSGQGRPLFVPSHFWLEFVNALSHKGGFPGSRIIEAIHKAEILGIQTIVSDRATLLLTIDRVERFRLSAYDALYLALTESLQGSLVTLDDALIAAAGVLAIRVGRPRLSEAAAVYERDVTWPDYKGLSAMLSKLRADTRAGRAG
jgi:predicted nucleic acid-binding protein